MSILSFIRELFLFGMTRRLLKSSRQGHGHAGASTPLARHDVYDDLYDADSIQDRIDELDAMRSRCDNPYGRRRFTQDEVDMIHDHMDMDDFEDEADFEDYVDLEDDLDLLEDDLDLFEDDDLDDDSRLFSYDLDPYANDDFSDSFDGDDSDGDFDI